MNILQITDLPQHDNSIESYEIHTYSPYNNSFKENDEIRIPIHQQDIYVLPSASFIYIEGKATIIGKDHKPISTPVEFTNNAMMFLFQDIRYEMNGVEIDRIKNPGITTTIKSFISMDAGQSNVAAIWGWNINGFKSNDGSFSVIIPLNKIMGFAEDYTKIIMNCKHELVLNRSNSNLNSVKLDDANNIQIEIERIQWRVPHVKVSDRERLTLLKLLEKDKPIQLAFRNWDLYEYDAFLPRTTKHSWSIKTASQLEKPRQNENFKSRPVDVRLEIECSQDIPENTTAYCLIINDRLIEYKPLSNIVRKLS
ncbi:uncharacterized protein [Maniola hyperantus]|uniref:uncharacterized protein n=1 Tax=Aphantopus hyperantus TaxID=2795564 RepID=UPI003749AFC4